MAALVACPICLDPPQEPQLQLLCGHTYCQGCFAEYQSSLITDGITALKCCVPECKEGVPDWILETILDRATFEKYDTFRLNQSLQELTIFYCPNSECKNAVSLDSNEAKKVTCPACQKAFCFQCRVLWHQKPVVPQSPDLPPGMMEDQSCEDYQKRIAESKDELKNLDQLAFEFVRKIGSKQCPRCKSWIEKAGGCEHVHCSACNLHFWWTTMKPLRKGYKLNNPIKAPSSAGLAPTELAELPPPDDSSDNDDDGRGAGIAPGSSRFRKGVNKGGGAPPTEEELHGMALSNLRKKIQEARRKRAEEAGITLPAVKATTAAPAAGSYQPAVVRPFTRVNLLLQTNATLSGLCREHHLPVSGSKLVLAERLLNLPQ